MVGHRVYVLAALLCVVWLAAGCKGGGPKTFDEAIQLVDKFQSVAEKHGLAWTAELRSDGNWELYERAAVGLDSNISLVIHAQGNTQAATGVVAPAPVPGEVLMPGPGPGNPGPGG